MTSDRPSTLTEASEPEAEETTDALLQRLQQRMQAMSRRLSEPQINSLYSAAYHLLQQGSTERAASMFRMLIVLRPDRARYWHAVGICQKRQNEFAFATEAFGRAFELDPAFLDCGLMQAESMLLMERRTEAAQVLDRVEALAREQGNAAVMVRAEGLRELIQGPGS
jgi:predicted Zn-dependent protease